MAAATMKKAKKRVKKEKKTTSDWTYSKRSPGPGAGDSEPSIFSEDQGSSSSSLAQNDVSFGG